MLLVVVDQMRYDYLERFEPLWTGGFARLLDEGVSFTAAYHEHAVTTTGPGHATLVTGRYPRHHGIVDNGWFDLRWEQWRYAVEDDRYDRSPRALQAPTLGDWIKRAYPHSRVFAAGGKDRSAILLAGRDADAAFWYDREEGAFTSSAYYPDREPLWLADFNAAKPADELFGTPWEPLPEAAAVGQEMGVEPLDLGLYQDAFPHPIGGLATAPSEGFHHAIYSTPALDALLARLAVALIEGEELGESPYPDFLGLSFSALDTVGHDWGPDSPEVLDTLLRLDRVLGELLAVLDRRIGLERVVVGLSSDHGVVPVPEVRQRRGLAGRRIDAAAIGCVQRVGRDLARDLGGGDWVLRYGAWDEPALVVAGVDEVTADARLREAMEACPGVVRVWTRHELAAGVDGDPMGELYARSYHPERSAGLLIQFEEYLLPTRMARTTHGSPYPYDRHVPWLLRVPGGVAGRVTAEVATVDVAPTLAAALGLAVPGEVDGVDRSALLPGRP